MKTKWIFRADEDFSKEYSDFKTMEDSLNHIYEHFMRLSEPSIESDTRKSSEEIENGRSEGL